MSGDDANHGRVFHGSGAQTYSFRFERRTCFRKERCNMRFPSWPRFCLVNFLLLVAARSTSWAQADAKPTPDARFGNVLYKTPDPARWSMTQTADRRVFSAKLPPPDFCTLTVFAGGKLEGDFPAAFDRAIRANLHERNADKIEGDGGDQSSAAAEGFAVLQRTLVAEAPGFHTYHWFLAGHSGDRFDLIAFQASTEEMYKFYGQAAYDFFTSVKLANSLPATAAAFETDVPKAVEKNMATTHAAAAQVTDAPPAKSVASVRKGPLAIGDPVEIPWAGGWVPGTVLYVEGLTAFVHYKSDNDQDTYDDFFTLNLIRPPGGAQTYADLFHGTMPDPEGGSLALGTAVEYYEGRWIAARIARKLGDRYVVFSDKAGDVTEKWVTLDKLRLAGSTTSLAPEQPFAQRRPTTATDIRVGDLVDAKPRRGFWNSLTVWTRDGDRTFVKIAPNSGLSMRGWVDFSKMRPVGTKEPFKPEDLSFFVGHWRLTGDSFQNLIDRKVSGATVTETYQNNSGAGKGAGEVIINADGSYVLSNTVVYHDGKGRWERNPNQDEGGVLLRGADSKGKEDCLVTNHLDGYGYLQGAIRGPGKWCTRVGKKS